MRQLDPARVESAFSLFGINVAQLLNSIPPPARTDAFNQAKQDAKKAFKKLAFECHPDRNGGDDTRFKQLSEAMNLIEQVEFQLAQPPPVRQTIRVVFTGNPFGGFGGFSTTSTTASSTSTVGGWW